MRQNYIHVLWLLPLAAVLFSANISGYDLWPPDEPRFGEVAREMLQSGNYLMPTVNGVPYQEKPPLLFWIATLASLPSGEVTEVTARIPSLLAGLAAVLFTFLLALELFGKRVAILAALIMMTCFRVWWEARTGRTDMLLGASLAATLYFFWQWEESRRTVWLIALYGALVAATYAKGPMGLLFSALFILVFYWGNKPSRKQMHWIIGALLIIAAGLLWFIPARMAAAGVESVSASETMASNLLRNTLGRFMGASKAAWPWYYFETVPADLGPWALFLPWTIWWTWKRRGESKMMRFLLCWTVPAFIFMSISIGKQAQYLLPLFPAFAILSAAAIVDLMDSDRVRWRKNTARVWGGILVLTGLGSFGILLTPYNASFTAGVAALALVAVACGLYTLFQARKSAMNSLPWLMAGQMAALCVLTAYLAFPVINQHKSARSFCAPVHMLAENGQEYRLYSVGFSREEYIFYSKHFHEEVLTGLVGLEGLRGIDMHKMAEQQKKARKLIAMSVKDVPIADISAITPQELQALRQAMEKAIQSTGKHVEALKMFEGALQNEIDTFAKKFSEPSPAFMFVQNEDWRWLYTLHSTPPAYTLVRHQNVGSRNVLLLANASGAALVQPGK